MELFFILPAYPEHGDAPENPAGGFEAGANDFWAAPSGGVVFASAALAEAARAAGDLVYSVRVAADFSGDEVYFIEFFVHGDFRTRMVFLTKAAALAGKRAAIADYADDDPGNPMRSHLTAGPEIKSARVVR